MRIVFSRCVWMKYYKGNHDYMDPPPPLSYQVGPDTENFKPTPIGPEATREFYCFGFSQHGQNFNLKLGEIAGPGIPNDEEYINDVLVVFFALPPDSNNKAYVVGWYKNATVYRQCHIRGMKADAVGDYTSYFYFVAKRDDCVLLPLEMRNPQNFWEVPWSQGPNATYGYGRDSIWYANRLTEGRTGNIADLIDYKEDIINKINNYNGDNWINKYHD